MDSGTNRRRVTWPAVALIGVAIAYLGATCGLDQRPPLPATPPTPPSPVDPAPRDAGASTASDAGCVEPDGGSLSDGAGIAAPVRPNAAATDRLPTHFAVIGDYGDIFGGVAQVATLVKSWRPDFVITTGDNNYPSGGAETIDANIGQFFREFIHPYAGRFGCGATTNRFFPTLGNHDWYTNKAEAYLQYFQLPGNERYYDFVRGDVHFFALDSDYNEPDGVSPTSVQGEWLRQRLAASTARWQVVYMHHPPYSSGMHGPSIYMQWPYKAWGADVVFAGHDHTYERLEVDGELYIVVGLGGRAPYAFRDPVIAGSQFRFNEAFGAVLVDANPAQMRIRFYTTDGVLRDRVVLGAPE